jgi:AcrR family transcriptional regulator
MFVGVNIGLMAPSAPGKRGYHHGDLRNALVTAAAELAAKGGPGSVTIRAAAREVGVTPTAAYRHFAGHEELLAAAKEYAMAELTEAMNTEVATLPATSDPVHRVLTRLAAIGRGYIVFARSQPGLFRTVFSPEGMVLPPPEDKEGRGPYLLLLSSLDELVEVGYLSADRRPMAEVSAWAMVHGLAALLDGPLRDLSESEQDEAIVRSMVVLGHGLGGNGMPPDLEASLIEGLTA